MKTKLHLRFSNNSELVEVCFTTGSGELRRSLRGRQPERHHTGTFQWTLAVRAFAALVVETKLRAHSALSGEDDSLASNLDQALNKPPEWLKEMFGKTLSGEDLCKRIFQRSNPGRKRVGPVTVSLNPCLLPPESISISIGLSLIVAPGELAALSSVLNITPNKPPSFSELMGEKLYPAYYREIYAQLSKVDIFNNNSAALNEIVSNPSLIRRCGSSLKELECLRELPSLRRRFGLGVHQKMKIQLGDKPIRISIPAVQVTICAIFCYMRDQLGLPLEIDWSYPYGVELVNDLLSNQDADISAFAIGTVAPMIKPGVRSGYRPTLITPRVSHRVMLSKLALKQGEWGSGEYSLLTENSTSALFCFEELMRSGLISRKEVVTSHLEPDEVTHRFLEGDTELRSVQWFPHYEVQPLFTGSAIAHDSVGHYSDVLGVMFSSEQFLSDKRRAEAFDILFRDTWLELRQGGPVLEKAVRRLTSNREYMKIVGRITGVEGISTN